MIYGKPESYLMSTTLKSIKVDFPYFMIKNFFGVYEPKVKEALNSSIIAIMWDDGSYNIYEDLYCASNKKKIISWMAVQPQTLVFAYTRSTARKDGKAKALFHVLQPYLKLEDSLKLTFFTKRGFYWLYSKGMQEQKKFNIFV